MRMDPPVSVPIEAQAMPAATETADPLLDPPGDRPGSRGWRVGPKAESSPVVPNANSCRLHLPMTMAPAARSRPTAAASAAGGGPPGTREAAVVGTPATSMRSLTETGTPCSGPRYRPDAISRPAASAWAAAAASSTAVKALRVPSRARMRSRAASTTARTGTAPVLIAAAIRCNG